MRTMFVSTLALSLLFTACPAKPKAPIEPTAPVVQPESIQPKPARPAVFQISPENTSLAFVGAKTSRSHEGKFASFSGEAQIPDVNHLEQSSVRVEVKMSDFETDEARLTQHLKTADFFDVERFPLATFTSTKLEALDTPEATHLLTGELDFHGIKKTISIPVRLSLSGDNLTATSEFSFNRQDFGVSYPGMPSDPIQDSVTIKLNLTATLQP